MKLKRILAALLTAAALLSLALPAAASGGSFSEQVITAQRGRTASKKAALRPLYRP